MQGAGIHSADLLIVDHSNEAEHGDIVIAAIITEPACKPLYRRNGALILQSENSAYTPSTRDGGLRPDHMGRNSYSVPDHAQ